MATSVIESSKSSATSAAKAPAEPRLYSLDAFRGVTMIWMFSSAFGLHHVKDQSVLGIPIRPLETQFTHADWHGFYAWDMIQPLFMFIVGVAMPFAFARRRESGESWNSQLGHVLKRCLLLILLGTMARSISAGKPVLDVINVLGQLSFTYLAAFLVLGRGWRVQAAASAGLLAVHWAIYNFAAAPEVTGAYDKNANIGWWLDGVILGKHWGGGYATINCMSSAANTIWGVMAGDWLRSQVPAAAKIKRFLIVGAVAIAVGLALDPIIPNIKKIWTASFAVSSVGITLWTLALFYWLCDVKMWRKWAHILMVVGTNSIFIYLFHEIMYRWLFQTSNVLFGWTVEFWGPWGQAWKECAVVAFQIYVCYWLYQRRIFFKL